MRPLLKQELIQSKEFSREKNYKINVKNKLKKLKQLNSPQEILQTKNDSDNSFDDFAQIENKLKNENNQKLVHKLIQNNIMASFSLEKPKISESQKNNNIINADEDAKLLEAHLLQLKEEIDNEDNFCEQESLPISSIKGTFNQINSPFNISKKYKNNDLYDPDNNIFSKTLDLKNVHSPVIPKQNDSLRDLIVHNSNNHKNKINPNELNEKFSHSHLKQNFIKKSPFIEKKDFQFDIDNIKQQVQLMNEGSANKKLQNLYTNSELPIKKEFILATGEQQNIRSEITSHLNRDKHFSTIIKNNINTNSSLSIEFRKKESRLGDSNIKLRRRNTRKVDTKRKSKLKDLNLKIRNEFANENSSDLKSIKLVSRLQQKFDETDPYSESNKLPSPQNKFEMTPYEFKGLPQQKKKIKSNIPRENNNKDNDDDQSDIKKYLNSLK